jgi:DNA-binding NarL/FixJ family response regulator
VGTVIHLRNKLSEPPPVSEWVRRIEEVLLTLRATADGIIVAETTSEKLVRCVNALQKGMEALDDISVIIVDSENHAELRRWTESINAKLVSELAQLTVALRTMQLLAEKACLSAPA